MFLLGICNEVLHMITTINHRSVKKAETTPNNAHDSGPNRKTTKGYVHQGAILAPSSANFTNFGTYLNFTVAMVTKIADKIGLKQRNCHFGPNVRLLEIDF